MRTMKHWALAALTATALALAGCGGGGSSGPTAAQEAAEMRSAEMAAVSTAIEDAEAAVAALTAASSDEDIEAAAALITAVQTAIDAGANLSDADKTAYADDQAELNSDLATKRQLAETTRERDDLADAEVEAERMKAEAEARATAMKLHAGIGDAPLATEGDGIRGAAYSGTDDADITVTMGTNTQVLTATKMAVVANDGWEGKQYTASGEGVAGTYEAVVFSNPGEPTEGEPLPVNAEGVFSGTIVAANVASSQFDQSAGEKEFDPLGNDRALMIPGSYDGVSGTYSCAGAADTVCTATKAATGFTLGGTGATWTFEPTDPEARTMSAPDPNFASYGWWLHKSEDDGTYTASAFHDYKGDVTAVTIGELHGTATYTGGAAGKYALHSSTGGKNDAGHFTANAMLGATFAGAAHEIDGMIDGFVGADGETRDWSIKLKTSTAVSSAGAITGGMTVWTIDGASAADSGGWSGMLHEQMNQVPTVATGTFSSQYGVGGNIVGAFGATKE